ncbi:MAG TPA: apolipoprotein N-acyltransferase [Acidimicrobiales bacterium]|nr:apolipoprotein N-acyltransferase [Acidimicrobiales bacterium]
MTPLRPTVGAVFRRERLPDVASLAAGAVTALALPPWGWWPLALVGLVGLDRLIADQARRTRFRRGLLVGLGLYVPSLAWMLDMTAPGYAVAAVFYAALLGVAAAVVPAAAPGRWLALPGAIALVELLRWSWPFGGVPLSSLAVGQVAGPLAPVLRIGGALLLVEATVIVGVTLAAALNRRWLAAGVGVVVAAAGVLVAVAGPRGEQVGTLRVALVQGGGPQGTRASDTDEREVFERHLAASEAVDTPVDLVVWPEDIVDVVDPVADTREGGELRALAQQLDAPLVVGVVEDAGRDHFRNAAVAYDADGEIVDRYDKVHRVPFGEYVPLRSLVERLGGEDLASRDAIVGERPAELDTPAGHLSVAISWEIFFGDRVREGVEDGAEIVLNPTNGSSFTGTLVQTQQVATSRMRAIENDRWVLQVAPTGFSAIVGPDGTVHQRSSVSDPAVLQQTVGMREGTTVYTRLGLLPAWIVALVCLALGWATAWRQRCRRRESERPRAAGLLDVEVDSATVVAASDGDDTLPAVTPGRRSGSPARR